MSEGTPEFLVLRALALKGRADGSGLAHATGLSELAASAVAGGLVAHGWAREARGAFMLAPAGRDGLRARLDAERGDVDGEALDALYEDFTGVNADFKALAVAWQLRDGEPNDHSDATYDGSVLDRLTGIHERLGPLVGRCTELVPRLSPYASRFQHAVERVQAGETDWLLKPLIDSYHTVWFEFHEELIGLAGRSREQEAASGRAE